MKNLIHDFKSSYQESEDFRIIVKSLIKVLAFIVSFSFFLISFSIWLLYLGRIYK